MIICLIAGMEEGAVDKALKLNGSEVGGWKVCAKAYPFEDNW